MRETIKEYTTTLNLLVAYPGAATTLIDTFVEHIAIECTEHENPSLSHPETTHQAI